MVIFPAVIRLTCCIAYPRRFFLDENFGVPVAVQGRQRLRTQLDFARYFIAYVAAS